MQCSPRAVKPPPSPKGDCKSSFFFLVWKLCVCRVWHLAASSMGAHGTVAPVHGPSAASPSPWGWGPFAAPFLWAVRPESSSLASLLAGFMFAGSRWLFPPCKTRMHKHRLAPREEGCRRGARSSPPGFRPPCTPRAAAHISQQLSAFEIHFSSPLAGGFAPSLFKRLGADRVHSQSPKAQGGGGGGGILCPSCP